MGVFWPCPEIGHPGTPRLFEDVQFYTSDKKAHFNAVTYRPSAEEPDTDYPVILTTGRVVSQYLSGTQTRRIGALVTNVRSRILKSTHFGGAIRNRGRRVDVCGKSARTSRPKGQSGDDDSA